MFSCFYQLFLKIIIRLIKENENDIKNYKTQKDNLVSRQKTLDEKLKENEMAKKNLEEKEKRLNSCIIPT